MPSGRHQRLGFLNKPPALPQTDHEISRASETAAALGARGVALDPRRHSASCLSALGVSMPAAWRRDSHQLPSRTFVMRSQSRRPAGASNAHARRRRRARLLQTLAVPLGNRHGRLARIHTESWGQSCAGCRAGQDRTRRPSWRPHRSPLTPRAQTHLSIAPSSEVLDVNVTNADGAWRIGEFRAGCLDRLRPPEVRCAQEVERTFAHPLAFCLQVRFGDIALPSEPPFVGCDIAVHGRHNFTLYPTRALAGIHRNRAKPVPATHHTRQWKGNEVR